MGPVDALVLAVAVFAGVLGGIGISHLIDSALERLRPPPAAAQGAPRLDVRDETRVHVEVIRVPPSGDWAAHLQAQLDRLESQDSAAELVSAVVAGGHVLLFYRRASTRPR